MKCASRGQTIIELVVAMPIVLFVLFAVIYLARFGVLSERAELALRYGGITAYYNTSAYSAANIYVNVGDLTQAPEPCPTPPLTVLTGGGPFPGPSPAPLWQPDTDRVTPVSTCTAGATGFGGAQFLASHYVTYSTVSVSAGVDVPPYLQSLLGQTAAATTSTHFEHAATPGFVMYCSTEVHDRVWGALTAESTTATPPPSAGNNGICE